MCTYLPTSDWKRRFLHRSCDKTFLEIAQQTLNLYNMMNLMLKQHELSSPYEKTSQFSTVPSSVVALQTTKMCLPEDYAIQDLARIVENHFIELKTIKKHEL